MAPRLVVTLLVCLALPALADIPPANAASCQGKQAGAACTMDDGSAGVCSETVVSRPDYSKGIPPGTKQVKMLLCAPTATAMARSPAFSPLATGLFLTLLAAGAAWAVRRRPDGRPSPT
jgi:hypothetical protein